MVKRFLKNFAASAKVYLTVLGGYALKRWYDLMGCSAVSSR